MFRTAFISRRITVASSCTKTIAQTVNPLRALSVSSVCRLKEIKIGEDGNKIIIEGNYVPSPRENYVARIDSPKSFIRNQSELIKSTYSNTPAAVVSHETCDCCLCKLDLQIRHTDVLVLTQFTNSKGKQLPRHVTGLCKRQHKRIDYLLVMAEKSGLIDVYTDSGTKRELAGWESFNKYYDESVIDEFLDGTTKRGRA